MTRPHAADDFAMIRARMEELRRERTPPRAADDFAAIRARIEEFPGERNQVLAASRAEVWSSTRGPIKVKRLKDRA